MKTSSRLLSAFLAASLCFSLAAPAALADNEPETNPSAEEVVTTPSADAAESKRIASASAEAEALDAMASKAITITTLDDTYTVDVTYPAPFTVRFSTNGDLDPTSVKLDGTVLSQGWSTVYDDGPNAEAKYYPKGWTVTIDAATIGSLSAAAHSLTVATATDDTYVINLNAVANTHVAQDYYLSNTGSDSNTGHSAAQAWASFDKLSSVTFGPGDTIYLDAASVWSNVHFQPKGSGAPGAPITLTKYNDGGDTSKRPILNGDGTIADLENGEHSYLAFDAWRKFFPTGTVELFNVDYWEVRGLEITNYSDVVTPGATGRNGIAVIHDYFEIQGITTMPASAKAKEEAFYNAGKLQHIIIEDNYVHDVFGYHPTNGAFGRGGKMSGGINVYGPYDDLKIEKNIVMYCDVEGIRNDVLAWTSDIPTQFPHYMEDVSISDNFIAGVPGDGVVISSAAAPRLANNYLTDAGYSYYATTNTKTNTLTHNANKPATYTNLNDLTGTQIKPFGNRENPMTMGGTNFAGLWFIGTLDAVAEYNESVNNVWVCNDGEAFDADMYCRGTTFQYNYTFRNNGGFALFMGDGSVAMWNGTIVRYNVSVEDGEGLGNLTKGGAATFFYNKEPEAIYNNLFILGENTKTMFGGRSDVAHFFNNMVVAPGALHEDYHLNGAYNDDYTSHGFTGEIKNNLFYPQAIFDTISGTADVSGNIMPGSLAELPFYDFEAFMTAQPIQALNGRSALTGTPVTMELGKGAGVAMTSAEGRSVKVPDGTGFDYTLFEGIKTVEGAATIGAGVTVTFPYQDKADAANPLTHDFFMNDITGVTTPDIGPYQWSADPNHFVRLTYVGNGATQTLPSEMAPSGVAHTLPLPSKSGYSFDGWYTSADLTGSAVSGSYVVPAAGITLYAKWEARSSGGGTPAPTPTPTPAPETPSNVTATEGGKVDTAVNQDGGTTYSFVPEAGKEVLYVRVNGLLVPATDSYTAAQDENVSIVAVFGDPGADHTQSYADTAAMTGYQAEAVNYVVASGLFQGVSGSSFDPQGDMSRAMFATVLARLYGADTSGYTSSFADVKPGAWYEGGVAWAAEMGFTSGVSATDFAPNKEMTRQELVTLAYRFAQKVGADVGASAALSAFSDADSVDDWAAEAMSWAVGLGLINGRGNSLAPNDTITRLEAAIVLQRMGDLLVKA